MEAFVIKDSYTLEDIAAAFKAGAAYEVTGNYYDREVVDRYSSFEQYTNGQPNFEPGHGQAYREFQESESFSAQHEPEEYEDRCRYGRDCGGCEHCCPGSETED